MKDDDEDNIRFNINNTPNIVNQQGGFILLMSPIKPFEEIIIEKIVQLCSTNGYLKIEEEKEKLKSDFISYDIHKKLKVYCIDKLSKKGVTEEFIFPKLEQLANEPLKSFLLSDSNQKITDIRVKSKGS